MKRFKQAGCISLLLCGALGAVHADYTKGATMFQIYGGGGALGGRYRQPGVDKDEQYYADGGGVIGGLFLYFISDSPSLALGVDISHAGFDDHDSNLLLLNRYTQSSANSTSGLFIARLSYPKGHIRPYIQGGVGAHHTSLSLDGTPINGSAWGDTNTTETRTLLDDGHVGPAVEGAIGTYFYFSERFFVGVEYKVVSLFGKDFEPTAAGVHEGLLTPNGSVAQSAIGFTLGLGF